jgi:formate dehydrogenase iron-sulfur subunit
VTRRRFLELAGVAAGATVATAASASEPAAASAEERISELAREHAEDPALLIDVTRCIGCGACVTACKLENDLEFREDQPALGPRAELASANWTAVRTVRASGGPEDLRYAKRQCLHCLEPACASACPVRALRKERTGPVTYDPDRCIGCRYCLMACPFGVPTFEWDRAISAVSKCDLCADRVARGEATACAAACPTGALRFGRRGALLREAKQRIASEPERYLPHVYGETEAGGTSVLYLSDVPFPELGLASGVPSDPLPDATWPLSRLVPPAAAGLGALLITLYARRRQAILDAEGRPGEDGEGGG